VLTGPGPLYNTGLTACILVKREAYWGVKSGIVSVYDGHSISAEVNQNTIKGAPEKLYKHPFARFHYNIGSTIRQERENTMFEILKQSTDKTWSPT